MKNRIVLLVSPVAGTVPGINLFSVCFVLFTFSTQLAVEDIQRVAVVLERCNICTRNETFFEHVSSNSFSVRPAEMQVVHEPIHGVDSSESVVVQFAINFEFVDCETFFELLEDIADLQCEHVHEAQSAERRAQSAERRAQSAERRAQSAERRAQSAERRELR